jgi:hypothetical protein
MEEEQQLTLNKVSDAYVNAPPAQTEPTDWKLTIAATPSTYRPLMDFNAQKYNAAKRGVGFDLSFGEWMWYWLESGKLDQRGAKSGQYQMARRGPDIGPYKRGNVDIKVREANLAEADYSKAWPEERRDMMRGLYTGTTKGRKTKAAMSKAASSRVLRGDLPPDRSKPCYAGGALFKSRAAAAEALGCNPVTVLNRINAGKDGYKWA